MDSAASDQAKKAKLFFLNLLFLHLSKRLIGNLYVSIDLLSGMTMDSHQGRGAGKAPNHHHHHRIDFLLLDTFAWSFTFKATCFTSSKVNFPSPLTSNSSIMALTCVKERFRWANFNSPRETYLQIKPDLISKNKLKLAKILIHPSLFLSMAKNTSWEIMGSFIKSCNKWTNILWLQFVQKKFETFQTTSASKFPPNSQLKSKSKQKLER